MILAGMLARAAELHPTLLRPQLYLAQAQTTLPYYARLAELYDGEADRLFEAATQLGALGHPQRALELFDRALMVRPKDFRIRLNKALLLAGARRYPDAVELLATLRNEQPGSPIVLHNLGAVLLASGDSDAAISHLRESLAWDPDSLGARQSLAEAYLASGELSRAETELGTLLNRNPHIAEVHHLLGVAAVARGAQEQAVVRFQRATELNPYRAATRVRLGEALRATGQVEGAWREFSLALRLDPEQGDAAVGLAAVRLSQDRFEEAGDLYLRALDIAPESSRAASGLGQALVGQGRSADAAQAFCLAIRLDARWQEPRRRLMAIGGKPEACGR